MSVFRTALSALTIALLIANCYEWTHCCWEEKDTHFGDLEEPRLNVVPVAEEDGFMLSRDRFIDEYVRREIPVKIRHALPPLQNAEFSRTVRKRPLVRFWGDVNLTLSTANTQSYDKVVMTLREYVNVLIWGHRMSRLAERKLSTSSGTMWRIAPFSPCLVHTRFPTCT